MRKILAILVTAFFMTGMLSTSALADAAKGQKYYLKFLKKKTGMNGGEFAAQHTQMEWKELFANNGEKFIEKYSNEYPGLEDFFNGDRFKGRYMEHVADFLIEFASDSGNVPSC